MKYTRYHANMGELLYGPLAESAVEYKYAMQIYLFI